MRVELVAARRTRSRVPVGITVSSAAILAIPAALLEVIARILGLAGVPISAAKTTLVSQQAETAPTGLSDMARITMP